MNDDAKFPFKLAQKTPEEVIRNIPPPAAPMVSINQIPLLEMPENPPAISTWDYLASGVTIYLRNYISSFFMKGQSMSTDLKTNILAAFTAVATLLAGVFHWTLSVDMLTTIGGILVTVIFFFIGKSSNTPPPAK